MTSARTFAALALLAALLAAPTAHPQCGQWHTGFAAPGVDHRVQALRVLALGPTGTPALYVGGIFALAGDQVSSAVARWDGTAWSRLGLGLNDGVSALEAFDSGSGPQLIAAGLFTASQGGATPLARIARWTGASWQPLGAGLDGEVAALAVYDEGAGPRLFAAGRFVQAGGAAAQRIARWNGTSWSPLGTGMDLPVLALCTFDDGNGPALYAGGEFITAGGTSAIGAARWNGTAWSAVGGGFDAPVRALAVHDDGTGATLYAGGDFLSVGGVPATRVARWNGSAWSPFGGGVNAPVHTLASSSAGGAGELYAGGAFTTAGGVPAARIARWNGTTWSTVGSGISGTSVLALATFDEGAGPRLFAGGDYPLAGGIAPNHIARWDGAAWSGIGGAAGFLGTGNDYARAFAVHDAGAGPELYAGGVFRCGASGALANVARFGGGQWHALGNGLDGEVIAFETYDDGSGAGPELYAAGRFRNSGPTVVDRIARWDGGQWLPVGGGLGGDAFALEVYDDGTGPALYVAGVFDTAGGAGVPRIVRWNGTQWSSLPATGYVPLVVHSTALAVFDDGSGPALVAGGVFGPPPYSGIVTWRAGTWTNLAYSGDVRGMAIFDAGTGPELYVASLTGLKRRSGGAWIQVTNYFQTYGVGVFDDGSGAGPALYTCGTFASSIARWHGFGTPWEGVGGGLLGQGLGLIGHDDGSGQGPALYVGGPFTAAGLVPSRGVARFGGCDLTRTCAGDGFDPAVTTPCPCANFGAPGRGCASSANAEGGVLAAVGQIRPDSIVLHATGLPAVAGAIFLTGDGQAPGGIVFGDGVRCIDGTLRRLVTRTTSGGAVEFPSPGDPLLSVRSGTASGSGLVLGYQVVYRATDAAFCPPGTSNVTNGVRVRW